MTSSSPGDRGRFHYESAPYTDGWQEEMFPLPEWSGPTDVMIEALRAVQRDVDAAGLNECLLSYVVTGGTSGHPVVNVQWRDGGTNDGVELDADSVAEAAVDVAGLVAQGFIEAQGIYWPTCPAHGRPSTATVASGPRAVWVCERSGQQPHELADVGDLRAMASDKSRLWLSLDQLARP